MENSIKSNSINRGLYLGGFLVLVTVLGYVLNMELLVKWWLGILLLLVIVIVGIVSVAKAKDILEGFISFKQAFTAYFVTVAIGVLISVVFNIILFVFIDPEAAHQLQQQIIDNTVNMMEGFGAPADAIAEQVDKMESQNQFSLGTQLMSIAWQLLIYAVIGLIVAAIMKKSNPDA